jgi:hypothetical protein
MHFKTVRSSKVFSEVSFDLIVLVKKKSNLIICEFLSTQKGIKGMQTKTQKEKEEKHDSFGCSTDGS